MDTAVVVPAYNEADRIATALEAFVDQDATVVVVVGGSDGTETVAREHPGADLVVEDEAENGPAAARNQGARLVDAEVVCFTDADTVVGPEWVSRHRRHYEDEAVVGVGGPLRPYDGMRFDRVMFKLLSDWWYRGAWAVGFVQASGNNCSYRRGPFLAAGGFDEEMPFIEDTECSLRMNDRGRMVFDAEAWVETSVRRQREQGYASLFLTYARGYLGLARGRTTDPDYFQDW
jgi:glycosyltransferase involved in cell wall biosynthesis